MANDYGLGSEPELLAGVGFGKYSARVVLNKLQPGATMPIEEPEAEAGVGNALSADVGRGQASLLRQGF